MADFEFGNKLASMRIACGYSQYQIGCLVGVTDKAVSKWENGQAKPRMAVCKKLADIYGVTLDVLLNNESTKAVSLIEKRKEQLWCSAKERLYAKFGPKPAPALISRYESERVVLEKSDMIIHMNAIASIVAMTSSKYNTLFSGFESNGSFVAWLMGVNKVNPLPPYTHCPSCHHFELHHDVADGWDIEAKVCPDCGAPLERDGHAIPFAEYAYRQNHNLDRLYQISVPAEFLMKCKPVLDEAYRDIFQVQPYDTVIFGFRMNPDHRLDQDYLLLPLGKQVAPIDKDGYLLINSGNVLTDPAFKDYPIIRIVEEYEYDQGTVIAACEENRVSLSVSDIQDHSVYEAYWQDKCAINPVNKVVMLDEFVKAREKRVDFDDIAADTAIHRVEWNNVANLLKGAPICFSTLKRAETIFAKGDWENRYEAEILNGHFTLADIPVEPDDVYKKIISLITPDACVGMDFVLKIIADMREGKYLDDGMDEETRGILRALGLEEWYIDFMCDMVPFGFGESVINKLVSRLAISKLKQDGFSVKSSNSGFSFSKNRISICEDAASLEAREKIRTAIEERKQSQSPEEIIADFIRYLHSESEGPFQ